MLHLCSSRAELNLQSRRLFHALHFVAAVGPRIPTAPENELSYNAMLADIGNALWAFIVIAAIVVGTMIAQYNGLVRLRQLVKNAWADVDVYLKRRAELIPNIVESVKAYAKHEQTVLTAVTEARGRAAAARASLGERGEAESALGASLVNVLAVAESYPELKASANFEDLQKQLAETEKFIASARQYYNACVRDFNSKIETFPSNIIAGLGGFHQAEFFMVDEASEREAPSVSTNA